jgi:hypothetical protein
MRRKTASAAETLRIRKDTLIIVDPSDIQKPYARQMRTFAESGDRDAPAPVLRS